MNPEKSELEEIRILVFSIMGIRFGADMEMIAEMCEPDQAKKRKITLVHIHEKMCFHMADIQYESPKVLIIKDGKGRSGMVIDQPEAINLLVKIDEILPKPQLLEAFDTSSPIWGITLIDNEIVLLIDPFKLWEI